VTCGGSRRENEGDASLAGPTASILYLGAVLGWDGGICFTFIYVLPQAPSHHGGKDREGNGKGNGEEGKRGYANGRRKGKEKRKGEKKEREVFAHPPTDDFWIRPCT